MNVPDAEEFKRTVDKIRAKAGISLLTNDEVLLLAAAEIARTYSREEKGYA
jgi:hypothetical protein